VQRDTGEERLLRQSGGFPALLLHSQSMTVTSPVARMRGAGIAAVLLIGWLVSALPVVAHSELVSSIPAAGSSVESAPGMSIVLSFSEALKKGSKADVIGPSGATVGSAAIDPTDNTKLTWSPAAPLPPGSYTIRWTSIATDGDVLRGTIPFTVMAQASASPASASPAASASASISPTPSPSSAPGNATSTDAGAIVPVVAALAVIAGLAFALLRRRRPT